jgi:hypothetical protein
MVTRTRRRPPGALVAASLATLSVLLLLRPMRDARPAPTAAAEPFDRTGESEREAIE